MATYNKVCLGRSERYRNVVRWRGNDGGDLWGISMYNVDRFVMYRTEREAAIAVDRVLIRRGKDPVNILRRADNG